LHAGEDAAGEDAAGEGERVGGILLMVLVRVALCSREGYELPYRCRYAHRRLARLGSPRFMVPTWGGPRRAIAKF
jgi:hypothetical protein